VAIFSWFDKRKRSDAADIAPQKSLAPVAPVIPAALAQPACAPAEAALQNHPPSADLALTVPASLFDSALTRPAALESLQEIRTSREVVQHSNLAWLLNVPAPQAGTPLMPAESKLLQQLDLQLSAPNLPPSLLPRAAAVVPQLLGLLRREEPPRAEVARQVAKDVQLAAEVLRVAQSASYGMRPVERLEDALDRIGEAGLRQAMTRVLFKPVFQASAGGLVARVSARLWIYAEVKSTLCAELTEEPALRFEAFMAGLMHDTGWIALLRMLERARATLPAPFSSALDSALAHRRDQMFGRLTADWALTPGLTRLSQDMASSAAASSAAPRAPISALEQVLRDADRLCIAHVDSVGAEPQFAQ
jgi:HDOD domain